MEDDAHHLEGPPDLGEQSTYHELSKAQKLAVSTKRQVEVREKLHSNHIRMAESKQTYNPYHLSSYKSCNRIEGPAGTNG